MQTIINNHLSSMLDKLLEKALEEKPKKYYIKKEDNNYFFEWDMFRIVDKIGIDISIYIPSLYDRKEKDWFKHRYPLELTPHQKELINKIFEKWSNTDDTNSK